MKRESKAEILMHPIRIKIVQEFAAGRKLTAKELLTRLPSVPQATLYRHIDKLVQTDILEIAEENQVRGTVEKLYRLNIGKANFTNNDLKELTREEHFDYFILFMTQLMKNFENYLEQEDLDFERDGLSYRQAGVYLSDQEFLQFIKELGAVFQKVITNEPASDRKKRIISTIIIPDGEKEGS